MQMYRSIRSRALIVVLLILPIFLFAQAPHHEEETIEHPSLIIEFFEWVEFAADIVGIAILVIGFLKGLIMFVQLEIDQLRRKKDHKEIFLLRNLLGSYIIISLDFLIVSDIIHSVVNPILEDLINLGIIVVLRTAIGFFLGKELNELKHQLKEND